MLDANKAIHVLLLFFKTAPAVLVLMNEYMPYTDSAVWLFHVFLILEFRNLKPKNCFKLWLHKQFRSEHKKSDMFFSIFDFFSLYFCLFI